VYLAASSVGKIGLYAFLTFIFSTISTGFARISIACLLLQVATARRWRLALWTTIVLQALVMIVYCVVQLAQCHSAISRKIDIKQTQCLTPSQVWSFTYVSISEFFSPFPVLVSHWLTARSQPGIAMFSDLVCALIPIFLIRSLTRSLVEKMLISLLLASCLIASGIGIAKLYCMSQFDFSSTDGLYLMVDMFIWSRAEESAIVIAACAPLLKVPVEKALRRLGVRGFSIPEPELNSIVTTMPDTGESKGSSRLEWGTDSQRSKTSGAPSSVQS